ncbi:MAG: PAS domain S-box protein [Proteobacteria bacterium]|nr:PAS domain S-box protein [Pseudomonadota bacterium]
MEDVQKTREQLVEELQVLRDLFEDAPYAYFSVDINGNISRVNRHASFLLGYSKEELLGLPVFNLYAKTPAGVAKAKTVFQRFRAGDPIDNKELQMQHKDGHLIWINLNVRATRDDKGNIIHSRSAVLDITRRKTAEAALKEALAQRESQMVEREGNLEDVYRALRQSQANYREIFDSATEMIGIQDIETGEMLELNAETARMTGYTVQELLDGGVAIFSPKNEAYSLTRAMEHMAKAVAGEPQLFEWGYVHKNGEFHPTEVHLKRVTINGRPRLMSTARDITKRKRLERESTRLKSQFQQAQKLESLGILAGGIAHDFNNLLMGILGNAGLALVRLESHSPGREYIETIETTAIRAAELTNQMLAYSGRGKFVVQLVELSALVKEMGHLLDTVITKKALIKYDCSVLPALEADPSQLRQIVLNLITNASDALGDEDGFISVRTGIQTVTPDYLAEADVHLEISEGTYAYLEVSDTGCGMDDVTKKKIFDPFFSTKFAGRGLGLAAVLGIVRGHKGGITVESAPSKGTTVSVFLPTTDSPAPPPSLPPEPLAYCLGTATILVADDDGIVRATVADILTSAGFKVRLATDGQHCLEVFSTYADEIAVVLLDMTMPRMSGAETLVHLKKIRPDVRVVLSSGYTEQEVMETLNQNEVTGFIQKPYRRGTLLEMMGTILRCE